MIFKILWGGRWKEGAGMMTGEEMELCNSYLSTTGLTTKSMGKEGVSFFSHALFLLCIPLFYKQYLTILSMYKKLRNFKK